MNPKQELLPLIHLYTLVQEPDREQQVAHSGNVTCGTETMHCVVLGLLGVCR